jgi:valyl-tRNA synthetase
MAANAPQDGLNGTPFQPEDTTKHPQNTAEKEYDKEMVMAIEASLKTEQQEAEAREESTVDALADMVAKTRKISTQEKAKMIQNILLKPVRDNFDGKEQVEAAKALIAPVGGCTKIRSGKGWNGVFLLHSHPADPAANPPIFVLLPAAAARHEVVNVDSDDEESILYGRSDDGANHAASTALSPNYA